MAGYSLVLDEVENSRGGGGKLVTETEVPDVLGR